MKRVISDTAFTRLFGLVLAALVVSHVVSTLLFFVFASKPPPPPPPQCSANGVLLAPPPHYHERRPLPPNFWIAQAIQVVGVAGLAWYGARRLVRPIHQLTQAAERLGDNLDAPSIEEIGPQETRQAARLFNQMQDKIRLQLAERSRFLAAVSHDLRTPLTRLRLRSALLTDPALQAKMSQDLDDMAVMLDATLAYLRDDSQQEAWQQLDLSALLQTLAEDAQEQGTDVQIHLPEGGACVLTRPSSLRRCLENLLENAVRYGERAEIRLGVDSDHYCIEICDQGAGIPEDKIALVFEPFVRLEGSRNRHTGGVGLGLSIARDAARRLGATLSLRNGHGGGLIAALRVPRT